MSLAHFTDELMQQGVKTAASAFSFTLICNTLSDFQATILLNSKYQELAY